MRHPNPAIMAWLVVSMADRRIFITAGLGMLAAGSIVLAVRPQWRRAAELFIREPIASPPGPVGKPFHAPENWARPLIAAAEGQIGQTTSYDAAYMPISYPNGDVPRSTGVCTDVIIRAYRDGLKLDLQRLVHEDMAAHFAAYPQLWGLKKADSNIDHRRVPNLATFFTRHGATLPVSDKPADYLPGDIIAQRLPSGAPHILLITHRASADGQRPLCIHNIGVGARLDDALFLFKLRGHFRYRGPV